MDRRLILAIALSALVLMVFQLWVAPKPPTPTDLEVGGGTDSARVVSRPSQAPGEEMALDPVAVPRDPGAGPETVMGGADEDESLSLGGAEEEEIFEIETDLFRAVFTNRGGQLKSLKLARFIGPGRDSVQLVRGGEELGLVLDTPRGPVDVRRSLFSARHQGVPGGEQTLVFEAGNGAGLRVTKTYTTRPDSYLIDLVVEVRGAADATAYRLTWDGGIPPAERDRKLYDRTAATIIMVGKDVEKEKPGGFKKTDAKRVEGNVRWAGVRNKYFAAIMVPPEGTSTQVVATGSHELKVTGAQVVMPLLRGEGTHDFKVYLGPLDHKGLKGLGHDLEQAVDLGWKLFRPLSQLLLWIMVWMCGFIPNYGVVIIIISVATKVLFYPLTKSSLRSMKAMQQLQPQIQTLNEKYKNNPKRKQQAMMELYRENKVNPVGGCLPLLVQMPVFVALYAVLSNSITMRQAYFVGWIHDLSTPETLVEIGGFPIHVLPILMFLTTVAQQRLTPMNDPRQKMMGYMMPLVMLFIFYSFPAGLNLYWTVNSVLTVGQHWWIHREAPVATPAPVKA